MNLGRVFEIHVCVLVCLDTSKNGFYYFFYNFPSNWVIVKKIKVTAWIIWFICNIWKKIQNGWEGFYISRKILSLDFSENVYFVLFLTSILQKFLSEKILVLDQ